MLHKLKASSWPLNKSVLGPASCSKHKMGQRQLILKNTMQTYSVSCELTRAPQTLFSAPLFLNLSHNILFRFVTVEVILKLLMLLARRGD
jgi:hypothetical protein